MPQSRSSASAREIFTLTRSAASFSSLRCTASSTMYCVQFSFSAASSLRLCSALSRHSRAVPCIDVSGEGVKPKGRSASCMAGSCPFMHTSSTSCSFLSERTEKSSASSST